MYDILYIYSFISLLIVFLFNNSSGIKFNIVFLDPPYSNDVINDILNYLYKNKLLKRDAIVVCEYQIDTVENDYFLIQKERKYGYRKVVIDTEKDKREI